jgi:hypothetical protein
MAAGSLCHINEGTFRQGGAVGGSVPVKKIKLKISCFEDFQLEATFILGFNTLIAVKNSLLDKNAQNILIYMF